MRITSGTWGTMLQKLAEYRKAFGHCGVPTNCRKNPTLGRWVAAQRHRRKINALSPAQIEALDRLGFIWSPGEKSWESMFARLTSFRRQRGHSDVPTKWARNVALADWVQRQRLARRKGRLCAERVRRLDALEFTWAVYKGGKEKRAQRQAPPAAVAAGVRPREERLYCLRSGAYVQHDGRSSLPPALRAYAAAHGDEMPPYIPLPRRPVIFALGEGRGPRPKLRWKGKGPLPREVIAYTSDEGRLPPYE